MPKRYLRRQALLAAFVALVAAVGAVVVGVDGDGSIHAAGTLVLCVVPA